MRTWIWTACLLVALAAAPAAQAMPLSLVAQGLDLIFDGNDLYDAGDIAGGNLDGSQADELDLLSIVPPSGIPLSFGGIFDDVYADVYIAGIGPIPLDGTPVVSSGNGDGFGFDLFVTFGFGVPDDDVDIAFALNIDSFEIAYAENTLSIEGSGTATSIREQFGTGDVPLFNESMPIEISLSGIVDAVAAPAFSDDGEFITGFAFNGTGGVVGSAVPEPSTLLLVLSGAAGIALLRRRA